MGWAGGRVGKGEGGRWRGDMDHSFGCPAYEWIMGHSAC